MSIIQVSQVSEMPSVAEAILTRVQQSVGEKAVVVALSGDLGAGKTTLVQAIARALGIAETVTSPTYVVMKRYVVGEGAQTAAPFAHLVHIDAYRIEDVDEMRVLKFPELLAEKDTIICIEWPEHIAALIPDTAIKVSIAIVDQARTVNLS